METYELEDQIHVITSERITTAEQEKFLRVCRLIRDVMLNLNFLHVGRQRPMLKTGEQ